jgi:TonB-linked SusC/RagA family outer membrane protein
MPNASAESALQGRAAGVSIITPSAAVGQAPIVRIRGVSSITSGTEPLYVVDGIPVQTGNMSYVGAVNPLADINPADILSMDVLKDAAAAALYGSRASNGVVLITTRKGQADQIKVTYNTWLGVTQPSKTIEVMNARQYVELKNLSVSNRYGTDEMSVGGRTSVHGNKAYNLWQRSDGSYVDTDWSDLIFQTGIQHSHSLAVSGGSSRIQYYLSVNYTDQSGVIINDRYNRLGGAANITAKATDWLKFGVNLNATTSGTEYSDKGRNGGLFATEGYTRMALITPPNMPAYNEDGTAYLGSGGTIGYEPNTVASGYPNPAAVIEYGSITKSNVSRLISSYSAELTPIERLNIKTLLGIDYMNVVDERFNTPKNGDSYGVGGAAYNAQTTNQTITWTNTIQYGFSLGEHNFDLLAGMESYSRDFRRWGAYRTGLLDDAFQVYQADYDNTYPYNGGTPISERALLSYLGRINYDYMSKYMLSVNFRRDGYSSLSKNNRWGNFGGVSAAWRISEEAFFKPLSKTISDLKVKGSWGIVGNTDISPYAAKSYYSSGFYGTGGAYYLGNIADTENLKWESSTKLDLGFSLQLLRKYTVELDYYSNLSSDLILNVPVAPSKGIPSNRITTNAGKMTNAGIELTLTADLIANKAFTWTSSFNITTSKNEVLELAEGVTELIGGDGSNESNITLPGYSIGQLYTTPTAGVDPESGRRIFIGKDGTELLVMVEKTGRYFRKDNGAPYNESDISKVISGGTQPTYFGGWSNDFKYKGIDLSILFQYSGGNYIYNGTTATMSDMRFWNNSMDVYNNYWTENRRNAKYPLPIYSDNYSNGSAFPISEWVEKGDYLRLKTISLGYTFNTKNWPKKVGITALRIYAQAQNLFCITGYTGLDPEALVTSDNAVLQGGVDKNTMPNARVYTAGVNITF